MSGKDERPIHLKNESCVDGCVSCKHLKHIERYFYSGKDTFYTSLGSICSKIRELDDMED